MFRLLNHIIRAVVCFALLSWTTSAEQKRHRDYGTLRVMVVTGTGAHLRDVVGELFAVRGIEVTYRGMSSTGGILQLSDIVPGDYTLKLKPPGRSAVVRNLRIEAGRLTNLGKITVGPLECAQPGVNCDDFGYMQGPFHLPCIEGVQLLRDSRGSEVWLFDEELQRRVVRRVSPEWPMDARSGDSVVVYLLIGTKGQVRCAAIAVKQTAIEEAALAAAQKWEFRPVLKKGAPISVLGALEFRVP